MTWALFPEERYLKGVLELMSAGQSSPSPERVMAVVGGALLEEAVEGTIRERLINDPSVVNKLIEPDKPLGNMGPQIDLLRCLGAIDERTHSAFQGIVRIRNFFAHNLDASFDSIDKKFLKYMNKLVLHEDKTF